jgi:hypothetical protein
MEHFYCVYLHEKNHDFQLNLHLRRWGRARGRSGSWGRSGLGIGRRSWSRAECSMASTCKQYNSMPSLCDAVTAQIVFATDPNKQSRRAAKWVDEPGLYSMRVLTNCRQHGHITCVGYGGSISWSINTRGPANNEKQAWRNKLICSWHNCRIGNIKQVDDPNYTRQTKRPL